MAKKENEPNWQYEEPPADTLSAEDFIAYLGRNKIILREKGDNICRFARNNGIKFVEVKRPEGMKFGSNPHYFYRPSNCRYIRLSFQGAASNVNGGTNQICRHMFLPFPCTHEQNNQRTI